MRVAYSSPGWVLYFQHGWHSSFCDKMFSKHLHLKDEVILQLNHQQRKVCQFVKGVTSELQMIWLLRWLNLFIIDYKLSSSTSTWIVTLQLRFSDNKWNGHFSNCSFAAGKIVNHLQYSHTAACLRKNKHSLENSSNRPFFSQLYGAL